MAHVVEPTCFSGAVYGGSLRSIGPQSLLALRAWTQRFQLKTFGALCIHEEICDGIFVLLVLGMCGLIIGEASLGIFGGPGSMLPLTLEVDVGRRGLQSASQHVGNAWRHSRSMALAIINPQLRWHLGHLFRWHLHPRG